MNSNSEIRVCEKCQKALPDGYKYKCCEACRNRAADSLKKGLQAFGAVALTIASVAVAAITGGKINPKE